MIPQADELTAERIDEGLDTELLGHPVQVFPVVVSTDAVALSWARQHAAAEGALVVAEHELTPRGRRGGAWASMPGKTLAFSVVLRPGLPIEAEGLLWLLASVACAEGLSTIGLNATVKWPNDVIAGGRRVGMVKAEAQLEPGAIGSAILTTRVNVSMLPDDFPEELRPLATSLSVIGLQPTRVQVLAAILASLEVRYRASVPSLLDRYREMCGTLGKGVIVELMPRGDMAGTAEAVDEAGRLVVKHDTGRVALGVDQVRRLEQV